MNGPKTRSPTAEAQARNPEPDSLTFTGFPEYKRQPGRSRESDGKTGAKGEFQYGGSFRGYCLVTIGGSRNGLFRGTTNRRVFVATNVGT